MRKDLKYEQYKQTGEEIEKAVVEVLRSGAYILGPNTKALEQEFSEYLGVKHSIGLNSGTDALHLALRALDIGKGDEVITVAFTFVATTESIEIVGATPVKQQIGELIGSVAAAFAIAGIMFLLNKASEE